MQSDIEIAVSIKNINNWQNAYIDDFFNFNLLNKCERLSISFLSNTHKKPKNIYSKINWHFTEKSSNEMIFEYLDTLKNLNKIPKWTLFITNEYAVDCGKILELLDVYFNYQTPVCVCSDVVWHNENLSNNSYENIIKKFMPKEMHKKYQNWSGASLMNSHPSGAFALSEKAITNILLSHDWLNWKKEVSKDDHINQNVIIGLLMTAIKIPMPNVKFMSEKINLADFSFLKTNGKCAVIRIDSNDSKNHETYRSTISNNVNIKLKETINYSERHIKNKEIVLKIKLSDKESLSGLLLLNENKKAIFTGKSDWDIYWSMSSPDTIILQNIHDDQVGEIRYGSNKRNCHIMINGMGKTITTFGTIYE